MALCPPAECFHLDAVFHGTRRSREPGLHPALSERRTPADEFRGVGTWHDTPAAQPGERVSCNLERELTSKPLICEREKMKRNRRSHALIALSLLAVFAAFLIMESSAWARAGRGGSVGSRGSRSFSAPSTPSSPSAPSPGFSTPGRQPSPGMPTQPQGGFLGRSPFMSGLAGGLAGGLLGSMLFGGSGHAATGGAARGGIGLLDLVIIGLILYFAWKFFRRRRLASQPFQGDSRFTDFPDSGFAARPPLTQAPVGEVEEGFRRFQQVDPRFSADDLKEAFQDLFFRIQAAWMNRSMDAIQGLVVPEMGAYFAREFEAMRRQGRVNRLENIAVRKVEPSEVWQEEGKDYVTVLITANLLDYTVDDRTGEIVEGDRMNPVKFQEFWTFCRDFGASAWRLAAINQPGETLARIH